MLGPQIVHSCAVHFCCAVDSTAPSFILPAAPPPTQATGPNGAVVAYAEPSPATDAVDITVPVTCTPRTGTTFAVGTTKVTCSATDKAGNTATAEFNVVVGASRVPKNGMAA